MSRPSRLGGVRRWAGEDARHDLSASLVVFLVAMPLSLGIAVASDAPITAGPIAAGARTRASAVLHGVWVLLFSLLLVGLIEQVPMAAPAGLLVHVGLTTVVSVVFLDLLMGVLIGFAQSVALMLRRVVWRS